MGKYTWSKPSREIYLLEDQQGKGCQKWGTEVAQKSGQKTMSRRDQLYLAKISALFVP